MATSSQPSTRQTQTQSESPTPWYGWPFVALSHLFWMWCLLLLMEWLWPWWQVGEHAKSLFFTQLDSLHTEVPGSTQRLTPFIMQWSEHIKPWVTMSFQGWLVFIEPYWQGAVYVTLSLAVRVLILFYCYPLFLLACFLGAFDGLVTRQRRVAFVARETETLHFYSRKLLPIIMIGLSYLWLFVPGLVVMPASWLLLPGAVCIGLLVRLVVASYKKYL
ncbi:DUF4400 domain-containing protein [Vibrio mediterranei]|nr:DUF4400 domain-containing protein [Vibrio mediterranei]